MYRVPFRLQIPKAVIVREIASDRYGRGTPVARCLSLEQFRDLAGDRIIYGWLERSSCRVLVVHYYFTCDGMCFRYSNREDNPIAQVVRNLELEDPFDGGELVIVRRVRNGSLMFDLTKWAKKTKEAEQYSSP